MSATPTASDRAEFRAFVDGLSDEQVRNVARREREAAGRDPKGRRAYADIAEAELAHRGIN